MNFHKVNGMSGFNLIADFGDSVGAPLAGALIYTDIRISYFRDTGTRKGRPYDYDLTRVFTLNAIA